MARSAHLLGPFRKAWRAKAYTPRPPHRLGSLPIGGCISYASYNCLPDPPQSRSIARSGPPQPPFEVGFKKGWACRETGQYDGVPLGCFSVCRCVRHTQHCGNGRPPIRAFTRIKHSLPGGIEPHHHNSLARTGISVGGSERIRVPIEKTVRAILPNWEGEQSSPG